MILASAKKQHFETESGTKVLNQGPHDALANNVGISEAYKISEMEDMLSCRGCMHVETIFIQKLNYYLLTDLTFW